VPLPPKGGAAPEYRGALTTTPFVEGSSAKGQSANP